MKIKEYIIEQKDTYCRKLEDLHHRRQGMKDQSTIDKELEVTRTRILVYQDLLNKYFK